MPISNFPSKGAATVEPMISRPLSAYTWLTSGCSEWMFLIWITWWTHQRKKKLPLTVQTSLLYVRFNEQKTNADLRAWWILHVIRYNLHAVWITTKPNVTCPVVHLDVITQRPNGYWLVFKSCIWKSGYMFYDKTMFLIMGAKQMRIRNSPTDLLIIPKAQI